MEGRMNSDQDAIWTLSPHVRSTHNDDGAVLLDIKGGMCYSLNVVAARAWAALESNKSGMRLEKIVQTLQPQFAVPVQELESDIATYLQKLETIGLVHSNGYVQSRRNGG